jgi:murein DD-endopeptidase MepM/ murein hydrolase activator NlpD
MKPLFSIIFLAFVTLTITGQNTVQDEVLSSFKEAYNEKDAEAVFKLFNSSMKASVDLPTTTNIVTTFQKYYGALTAFQYKKKEATHSVYTAYFEKGLQTLLLSLDENNLISGLLFKPLEDDGRPAKMSRNSTPLQLPFKGEWFTVWGGDTKAQNYHVVNKAQRRAFDFLIIKNNKTFERSGTRNEDYYAFGKPLYAVCDAEVIHVTTGVMDNKPGTMNPAQEFGNSIILKTSADEYIVYAHFEDETIQVAKGDRVIAGQYLGNCGNSGNSSEPHLHVHIQDGPDPYTATGVTCYFEDVIVNGIPQKEYSPVRLDKIAPLTQ